jgi:hypothetical protein
VFETVGQVIKFERNFIHIKYVMRAINSYPHYRSNLVLLAIVLSVLLRYTDSDCPFGIFKLFLNMFNFKQV